jgi:hypothetical protein
MSIFSKLDAFLASAGFDVNARLSKLSSSKVLHQCMQAGFESFVESYDQLYRAIFDDNNKFEFPSTIMNRSTSEVKTLLNF